VNKPSKNVHEFDFGTFWPVPPLPPIEPAEAATDIGLDPPEKDTALEMLGGLLLGLIGVTGIGCLALLVWIVTA
jgi:hypothetical protein